MVRFAPLLFGRWFILDATFYSFSMTYPSFLIFYIINLICFVQVQVMRKKITFPYHKKYIKKFPSTMPPWRHPKASVVSSVRGVFSLIFVLCLLFKSIENIFNCSMSGRKMFVKEQKRKIWFITRLPLLTLQLSHCFPFGQRWERTNMIDYFPVFIMIWTWKLHFAF